MRAFKYIRVSDDEQVAEGFSIEAQNALLDRKFAEWGFTCIGTYVDEGFSAKNMKRPDFQKMMKDVSTKSPQVIVFWRLDRFTRNSRDFQKMTETLEKQGCGIKSCTENIDTTTAMGRFQLELTISLGQLERETTSERVKFVMEERHRKGLRNGAVAPYGYDLVDGKLIINPAEAEVVKRIYELYERPMSDTAIAKLFNKEQVPKRDADRWSPFSVQYILTNPVYCGKLRWNYRKQAGKRTHNEVIIEGTHEPIISVDHFDRIERIRNKRAIKREKVSSDFHFTGVLRCGRCGYGMVGVTKRLKDGQPSRFYRCLNRMHAGLCDMPNFKEKALTEAFLSALKVDSDQYKKLIVISDPLPTETDIDQANIQRELEQIKKRRRKWQDAYANDVITLDELKERNKEEKAKEEMILARLEPAATHPAESQWSREEMLQVLSSIRDLWLTVDDELAKKRFIQEAFKEIVVDTELKNPKGGRFVFNKVNILDWKLNL
jgi:site-specific DNA recombinase